MEFIYEPWPWYVVGPMLTAVMLALIYFGTSFGVSGNLRTMCTIGGAGKFSEFFRFDWKSQIWNLIFVAGAVMGGFLAFEFLVVDDFIALNPDTVKSLQSIGIKNPGSEFVPAEIYGAEGLVSPGNILFLMVGGILIGFGSRYAGGCTSGHAISGLSDLQLPSLIAVIGFFIGGMITTHILLPYIL